MTKHDELNKLIEDFEKGFKQFAEIEGLLTFSEKKWQSFTKELKELWKKRE